MLFKRLREIGLLISLVSLFPTFYNNKCIGWIRIVTNLQHTIIPDKYDFTVGEDIFLSDQYATKFMI
jgi:hypothetical protein